MDRTTVPNSLEDMSQITKVAEGIYEVDLAPAFCIGSVPNGGYVATVFQKVAAAHLTPRNQPHTISSQWTFPSRTSAGIARLRVIEARLGRGSSVLHISLHQQGLTAEAPFIAADSRPQVVAYMTQGNIDAESGISLPTGWKLEHEPVKPALGKLMSNSEPNWKKIETTWLLKRTPVFGNVYLYVQRNGPVSPTIHDFWICLANGENFRQENLGFVVDLTPPHLVEAFRPPSADASVPDGGYTHDTRLWYPTLTLGLEVKKTLPANGAKWLRLRCTTKSIHNGRFDAEVIVFNDEGDLVALCNHVSQIVDFNRNLAKRKPGEKL